MELAQPEVVAALEGLGRPIVPFYGSNEEGAPQLTVGVAVEIPVAPSERILAEYRAALSGLDVGVFLASMNYFSARKLAIVRGADPFGYLALRRTSGVSADVSHDSLLVRLRQWDDRVGLTFAGAGANWFMVDFDPATSDRDAFVEEVLDFCSHIAAEPGVGPTRLELAQRMKESGRIYCWWRRVEYD